MSRKRAAERADASVGATAGTQPLWTVEDVAAYLRLKPETVRMLARTKCLPGLKVGKVWRFRAADINEALRAGVKSERR